MSTESKNVKKKSRTPVMERQSRACFRKLACQLFEDLGTPTSIEASRLLASNLDIEYSKIVVKPEDYSSWSSYKDDYMVVNFLKKSGLASIWE